MSGAQAQDMLRGVDLTSPDMTQAETTRAALEASIAAAGGKPLDLGGKKLSGLDLSGLDLRGANFRAARLNHARLTGARLDGAVLDQAWALEADFSNAHFVGATLFQAQVQKARFDGADLSRARIAADFSGARLNKAVLRGANGAADEKNQSMGLMRATFMSADLDRRGFLRR